MLEVWMMKLTTKLRIPTRDGQQDSDRAHWIEWSQTLTLVARQHFPPRQDDAVKNLQSQV